jgi:hypothetical protein
VVVCLSGTETGKAVLCWTLLDLDGTMASTQSSDHQQQELQELLQRPALTLQQQHKQQQRHVPHSADSTPVLSRQQRSDNSQSHQHRQQPQYEPLAIDDNLPTNVCTEEQLTSLPDFCLSGNKNRPLRHVNEQGDVSTYALRPMFYSVSFILMVELLERFSFYGINYTQTSFLTGAYNEDWNADMSAIGASSYVSISTAVAYSMPFVGAFLADNVFGDYWSILIGDICFYIPGLLLILLSSVPYLLGDTFNKNVLSIGLLGLWPIGTGIVKSIVNVFGAKQVKLIAGTARKKSDFVDGMKENKSHIICDRSCLLAIATHAVPSSVAVFAH